MAELAHLIELRQAHKIDLIAVEMANGRGKQLMDDIRDEIHEFKEIEQTELNENDVALQASMQKMFSIIIAASFIWSLFELAFIYFRIRQPQQQIKYCHDLRHLEYKWIARLTFYRLLKTTAPILE